jgi:preprotein translocase subunit YajC
MNLFIPDAIAAPAAGAGATMSHASAWSNILVMLLIFVGIMYFLIWRPQNKRIKSHQSLVSNLKKGDEVMTNGGIVGKLVKVADNFVSLELAEGVKITMQKSSIASVLPKGTLKKL